MRFTVTALGSAGDRPVGVVVGTIARYLVAPEPRPETPGGPSPGGGEGEGSEVRYYADRGDTLGRWLGQGSCELGLAGDVDFDDFTSVLAGRDPRTGARLITARGSAGRVASLGTGTVARWGPNGEALYSVRDAARIMGWSQADVRAAIVEGERLAASRLVGMLAGTAIPGRDELRRDDRARAGQRSRAEREHRDRRAGTGTGALHRTVERDGHDGIRTDASARHGRGRDGHPGRDAHRGSHRERVRHASRPGPGRKHADTGIRTGAKGRPGRSRARVRPAHRARPGHRAGDRERRRRPGTGGDLRCAYRNRGHRAGAGRWRRPGRFRDGAGPVHRPGRDQLRQ
jgi:hypothetical protein